jgi:hypothetical protein
MTSVIIRILLRYAAALLVAKGLLSPDVGDVVSNDPDLVAVIEVAAGMIIGVAAECWYFLARNYGWST